MLAGTPHLNYKEWEQNSHLQLISPAHCTVSLASGAREEPSLQSTRDSISLAYVTFLAYICKSKGPFNTQNTLVWLRNPPITHFLFPLFFCSFSASDERPWEVKMPSHNETVLIRRRRRSRRRKRSYMAAASPSLWVFPLLRLQPTLWKGLEVNNDNSQLMWSKAPLFPVFLSFYVTALLWKRFHFGSCEALDEKARPKPLRGEKKKSLKLYFLLFRSSLILL